jgi:hypothetical protein
MRIASQTSGQQRSERPLWLMNQGAAMNVKTGLKGGDDEGIVWGS